MSGHEFTPPPEKVPDSKPAPSGGPPGPPPRPPKITARDLLDPGESDKRLFIPDYIEVRDLAELLGVKPFKVVAEVLALGIFKHAEELIDFPTASAIARNRGFVAERLF